MLRLDLPSGVNANCFYSRHTDSLLLRLSNILWLSRSSTWMVFIFLGISRRRRKSKRCTKRVGGFLGKEKGEKVDVYTKDRVYILLLQSECCIPNYRKFHSNRIGYSSILRQQLWIIIFLNDGLNVVLNLHYAQNNRNFNV